MAMIPGVFTGRQLLPGTMPPPANEASHWNTLAATIAPGATTKWFVMLAEQTTLPPPASVALH